MKTVQNSQAWRKFYCTGTGVYITSICTYVAWHQNTLLAGKVNQPNRVVIYNVVNVLNM